MSGDTAAVPEFPHDPSQAAASPADSAPPADATPGPAPADPAAPAAAEAAGATGAESGSSPAEGAEEGDRLRQLEAEFAALQAEHENLRGQYMRMAADFDNFRKRQSRDRDDLKLQITCTTVAEILPVVDNFERARQQLNPQHEEAQALHGSYLALYRQLVDVLKQLGVSPMRVEGEPFDPTLHEAVLREPSEEHPEDVVIAELQRGYNLQDRVLRHALVKVSMGPGPGGGAPAADPAAGGGEQNG
ncbi:MAG: nucleotide exchange factor GrpE [Synechococcaceae cyanobacterium]|nr:nucleotide exchange factor GrpE [Synechococcaceae cyanobacterium]